MTRRRYVLFAVVAVLLSVLASTAVVIAADVYLHYKYADLVALNVWGYRGPVVGRKQPNEWRLAVLGESTAFGYGVHWTEAVPAYLERFVNETEQLAGRRVTVPNLAGNSEGAHSYQFTLRDYAYLDYDAVLFYSGYNDLKKNTNVFRHDQSAIFRLTGYLPLFPLIFQEKAMVIRWNGRLEDAYQGEKTTFRPNITQRATATALETAVSISESLEAQLGRMLHGSGESANPEGVACGEQWGYYCGEMYTAIKHALDEGKQVLMVTQPYINSAHVEQQERLKAFLNDRFGGNPRLHFANLGREIDLKDTTVCYDGMHLNAKGNLRIATALVSHVRALMP